MDALGLDRAVIVGHDFGASIAWNAALMRPDRVWAVFGISVPFTPRGDKSILQAMAEAGHSDFYMFSRMLPGAEDVWASNDKRFEANLYWSSAAAPREERWTLFNRDLPKFHEAPAKLPDWADMMDIEAASAEFRRTGWRGPLNWYRALQRSFELTSAFKGKVVQQPSFFLAGKEDGLNDVGGGVSIEGLQKGLPSLVGFELVPGVAHWPQLEAAATTSAALISFIQTAVRRYLR